MNTNEVKGKLWNICIDKGLFNKVKGENFREVQEIFEKIVKSYESLQPSQEIFDKVIDSLSIEIQNNYQKSTFEEIQKEYNVLLNTPEPKKIDFTLPVDKSISNQSVNIEDVLMTQNKILIQILDTQLKIINILDRLK